MVKFGKLLGDSTPEKPTDPIEIYDSLDRESDKGPLRPSQEDILKNWADNHASVKDLVIKLHTGQGKTLIGLLICQSKLNSEEGPAIYLCPNNFLVSQTALQAKQFGIKYCLFDDGDIPDDFQNSKAVLITTAQKLFNGRTKFGLGARSIPAGCIILDDAHACLDIIEQAFTIKIARELPAYQELLRLFSESLSDQGVGTFEEIKSGAGEAFLPVPYWDWFDKYKDATKVILKAADSDDVKFAWPLVKDELEHAWCFVSGSHIEIIPRSIAISKFGTFADAAHRVFMSATTINDAFFVRHLGLSKEAVLKPLIYEKERWSGEKMIILPGLLSDELTREKTIALFAPSDPKRTYGVVALTPSFEMGKLWEHYGAKLVDTKNIVKVISSLKQQAYSQTVVIANRYDGIDLPDDTCRILIIDGQPYADAIIDRYQEECRPTSPLTEIKRALRIEQGLGRNIRGEKDYGVVLVIGSKLARLLRTPTSRKYFSDQTQHQIEIALKIIKAAKLELEEHKDAEVILREIILQCLNRDEEWKQFYIQEMKRMKKGSVKGRELDVFVTEKRAEEAYRLGKADRAAKVIQDFLDSGGFSQEEEAWYLQEIARYLYKVDRIKSTELQVSAHSKNPVLLKPKEGMQIPALKGNETKRAEEIIRWIAGNESWVQLSVKVDDVLERLTMGVESEKFEQALFELGEALGFGSQRPDKHWGAGPDNLWAVRKGKFFLFECKNQVSENRAEIHKQESGQMNNALAWFKSEYPAADSLNVMIIPAKMLSEGAGFNESVHVMRPTRLRRLKENTRRFFNVLKKTDIDNLSEAEIHKQLAANKLDLASLEEDYFEQVKTVARRFH